MKDSKSLLKLSENWSRSSSKEPRVPYEPPSKEPRVPYEPPILGVLFYNFFYFTVRRLKYGTYYFRGVFYNFFCFNES